VIIVEVEFRDDVAPVCEDFPDASTHVAASFARKMKARADVKRVKVSVPPCKLPHCPWCGRGSSGSQPGNVSTSVAQLPT
jgi:hypothetical protein